MMQRLSAWFPVVLLALVAAVTVWLDRQVQPPEAVPSGKGRHDPDYIADNFTVSRIGPDGAVRYRMTARRMQHYPDDDSTELTKPRFMTFGQGAPMSITANHGLVSSNGGNLYFRGDVRAARAPYANNSELVVTTQYLHVLPDDNIARTDQPVTIQDASMTIDAVGMELNNETRILKLNAKVRGVYNTAAAGGAGKPDKGKR